MTIQDEIVRIAQMQVGMREVGGNNLGPRVVIYQKATWLDPGPWPWCAAFTAWVLREALHTPAGSVYLSDRAKGEGPDAFRCKDASAFGWIKWAGQHNLLTFDEHADTLPAAGDLVVYDFSHIGVVTGYDPINAHVLTCEGNTNGKGERDSVSGDGVWRKSRSADLVRMYIRL